MLRFTKPLIKVMLYSIIFCGLLFSISLAQTYTGHGVILDETTGLPLPTADVTGGNVYCVINDGSGGWFIGGDFTTVGGVARSGLAHLLSDGSLDAGWVANVSGGSSRVYAMANASGTGLFVGGNFTAINGTARNNIAKLNLTDGGVQSWYPAGGVDGQVFAIVDRNTNAVVGGFFTYGTMSNLIEINSTATFISPMGNPNNAVWALAIMNAGGNFSNAYLYVGGDYTEIFGTPLNRICRIYRDFEMGWGYGGSYGEWYPTGGADGRVRALTLAGAGSPWEFSVIAGGDFTTIGGVSRNRLAALSFYDASVETWNPDLTGSAVYAVASTGPLVYTGGDFSHIGTTARNNLGAVSTSTGLATTWDPYPNNIVRALALGSVFAGGNFDAMGAPAPEFSVTPTSLDFGTVTVGNFSTLSLTVHNTGSAQLNITNVTSSNSVYTVTPTSGSIAPSDSMSFDITFTPTSHGTQTGNITFTHNATGSPTDVPVTGFGKSQGGDLVFDPQTSTIFDNATGYESTVRLQNYVGTDLKALQFKIVLDGKLLFRSISRGTAVSSGVDWTFAYEIAPGLMNPDGSRNDTVKVVVLGNGTTQLPPGADYEIAVFQYDAINISVNQTTTTVHFEEVIGGLGTPEPGGDALINAGPPQDITINNRVFYGDVNMDDRVDILDILTMIDFILDRVTFTTEQFTRGDIAPWTVSNPTPSPDGEINAMDLAMLQNIILTGEYPSGEPATTPPRNPNVIYELAKLNPGDDAALTFYITENGISVVLESIVKVKGLQVEFSSVTSSTSGMNVETALGNGYYYQSNDILRTLVYEGSGSTIEPGQYLFLNMPFAILNPRDIKIDKVILANENNEQIEKLSIQVIYGNAPQLPTEYSLSQNYPNPFNPNTSVQFTVPNTSDVIIKVFDMLGQEVRTLFAGEVERGTYTVNWDGMNNNGAKMSSGSYVYRMTAGDFVQSKKMILMK